jgi:hypothetical protein
MSLGLVMSLLSLVPMWLGRPPSAASLQPIAMEDDHAHA